MENLKEVKHKFGENIENALTSVVVDGEYNICKSSKNAENAEFESIIQMLEGKRSEREYSWMSDVNLHELASIILTDASSWSNQYFQTRDFVETKLDGDQPDDENKAIAAKKCVNNTLNRRELYHYHKYIRARTINTTFGCVYVVCWWEKQLKDELVGYEDRQKPLDVDVLGQPITDLSLQQRAFEIEKVPKYKKRIIKDNFNYEVFDPRNVFTDKTYCYSVQDKKWIILRSERTYEELKIDEKKNGYFNLDIVKQLRDSQVETDTAKETDRKGESETESKKTPFKPFDRLIRFGKIPVIVVERDEEGYPIEIKPGYTQDGEQDEKAELLEAIQEFVVSGSSKILIRFQPLPFRKPNEETYRPILRGLCYIHPTKDTGLSDGKYLKEIEVAINDHFNMGSDRVKLATLPTMKGRKYSLEGNPTIYFAPEHVMELETPQDIEEFKISDNISGTLEVIGMLKGQGQQCVAIYPTTMGQLPSKAATTATAVGAAESRTTLRGNYKSLTYEYTLLIDLYCIILNMTWQFAEEETAFKLMGDYAQYFDPEPDYTYSPVTAAIELEYSKRNKLQIIDQMIGRVVNVPNPNTPKLLNYLLTKAFQLLGDEFPNYKDILLDTGPKGQLLAMQGGKGGQVEALGEPAMSNQSGLQQSAPEESARAGWR